MFLFVCQWGQLKKITGERINLILLWTRKKVSRLTFSCFEYVIWITVQLFVTFITAPLPPACPVSPQDPKGHTKLHVSHSFSLNSSDRSVASVQPTTPGGQGSILRHSHSEEKFRDPKQQTGTPSAFPSWKENLKPVTQVTRVDNNSNNTSEVDGTENICGVDERKPSGVNTLRCKFERASIGDPNIAQRQGILLSFYINPSKSFSC